MYMIISHYKKCIGRKEKNNYSRKKNEVYGLFMQDNIHLV